MLKFLDRLFEKLKQHNLHETGVSAVEKHTCKNCRFAVGGKYGNCWVGTYIMLNNVKIGLASRANFGKRPK